MSIAHAGGLLVFASGVFFAGAWGLNETCWRLSPLVLALLLGYSYTKRFTWLCHLILGSCLGMAPLAGWWAVTGTFAWPPLVLGLGVLFWVVTWKVTPSTKGNRLPLTYGGSDSIRTLAVSESQIVF